MKVEGKTKKQLVTELKALYNQVAKYEQQNSKTGVTNKENPKNSLIQSETRYSTLLETIPYGIEDIDIYGNILFGNIAYHKLYGYPNGKLIGKSIFDLVATEEEKVVLRNYLVFLVNNQPPPTPYLGKKITKQGKIIDVEIKWNYRYDNNHEVVGFTSVNNDITEQQRSKELINKFSNIVEQTADHVLITDKNGIIEYVNPAFEKLTGYSKEEVVGKKPNILKSGLHSIRFYEKLWNTVLSGEVFRSVLINKNKNNELFYEEKTITPIRNEKKDITHFVSTGKDVTESIKAKEALKNSEEKLRTIYESSVDAIMIHNGIKFLDCNLATLKIFRCKSKEEFFKIGPKDISSDVLPEGQLAEHLIKERINIALSKGVIKFESRAKRMDGTNFDIEVWVTPMKLRGETVFQSVVRDITERKLATNKMKQTKEKLRALASRIEKIREEERAYIAREIHDELGHTLTALLIDLHSLGNKIDFPSVKIAKELKTMIELVNHSIETIRKIASDLRPGILDKLGLGAAIEWQLEEFKKRNRIECIAAIEDEPLEELSKEKVTAIFRIFQEILTNITRHANAKKVKVILKIEHKKIKLIVNDDGKGILKENIDTIDSLGILGMQERASMVGGDFFISGIKKGGTEVKVLIPIKN